MPNTLNTSQKIPKCCWPGYEGWTIVTLDKLDISAHQWHTFNKYRIIGHTALFKDECDALMFKLKQSAN